MKKNQKKLVKMQKMEEIIIKKEEDNFFNKNSNILTLSSVAILSGLIVYLLVKNYKEKKRSNPLLKTFVHLQQGEKKNWIAYCEKEKRRIFIRLLIWRMESWKYFKWTKNSGTLIRKKTSNYK